MIPILYEATEKNFNHNGIGFLRDTIECTVTEERNGLYELELVYPIGFFLSSEILKQRIIKAKANDRYDSQLFRIYYISKPLDGQFTIKAEHISYDTRRNFIEKVRFSGNCGGALSALKSNTTYECPFNFNSDININEKFEIERINLLHAIIGDKGSIMEVYGDDSDLVRNNFDISIKKEGGLDKNVLIAYRKNITGFDCEDDDSDVITQIYPFAEVNGEILTLPEKYVYSKYLDKYPTPIIKEIDFSCDVTTVEELREKATNYFSISKADIPKFNYKIDFVSLSKTENYKNFKLAEDIGICDYIIVRHESYNINEKHKVIKTIYNTLAERYDSIEIGDPKTCLNTIIGSMNTDLKVEINKDKVTPGFLDKSLEKLSNAITGNDGGYIRLNPPENPSEILILDNEDINQSRTVWRWNKSGWGVSTTGYNGSYLGLTKDGKLVIDEATANKFSGALIQAGTILTESLAVQAKKELREGLVTETNLLAEIGRIKLEVSENYASKTNVESLSKSLEESKKNLKGEISDVSSNLDNLEENINGAFKDEIINEAETIAINEQIRHLDKERLDIDKKYDAIYTNADLKGTEKTNLELAKTNYINAHSSLKATINNAISDRVITPEENINVNNKFSDYNQKLSEFSKVLEEAIDAIGSEKVKKLETSTNEKISTINQDVDNISISVQESKSIVDNMVVGSNNHIVNSGDFKNSDGLQGNITLNNGLLDIIGQFKNLNKVDITKNTTYIYSAEIKVPQSISVTEKSPLSYEVTRNTLILEDKSVKKNLLTNTDNFSSISDFTNNNSDNLTLSVVSDATYSKVIKATSNTSGYVSFSSNEIITLTTNKTYCFSFYVKGSSSGYIDAGGNDGWLRVTTDWTRVHTLYTPNANESFSPDFMFDIQGDVYITNLQMEVGSSPSVFESGSVVTPPPGDDWKINHIEDFRGDLGWQYLTFRISKATTITKCETTYNNGSSWRNENLVTLNSTTFKCFVNISESDRIYQIRLTGANGSVKLSNQFVVGKTTTVQPPEPEVIPVESVTISPRNLTLMIDESDQLTHTISPSNADNKNVTYRSSNNAIATVSSNGTITGKSQGNTTITVTTEDGNKTDTCNVTINEKLEEFTINIIDNIVADEVGWTDFEVFTSIRITAAKFEVSYDDGTSWNKLDLYQGQDTRFYGYIYCYEAPKDTKVRITSDTGKVAISNTFRVSLASSNEIEWQINNVEDFEGDVGWNYVTFSISKQVDISKCETTYNGGNSWRNENLVTVNTTTFKCYVSVVETERIYQIRLTDHDGIIKLSNQFIVRKSCTTPTPPPIPENNAPIISNIMVSNLNTNGSYTITYTAQDQDNDTLTHKLKIDSNNYMSISPSKSGNSYTYNGTGLFKGNHTCYIQVSDGKATTTSSSFNITIPNNPAPPPPESVLTVSIDKSRYDITKGQNLEVVYQSNKTINKIELSTDGGINYNFTGQFSNNRAMFSVGNLDANIYSCKIRVSTSSNQIAITNIFTLNISNPVVADEIFQEIQLVSDGIIKANEWTRVVIRVKSKTNLADSYSILPILNPNLGSQEWQLKNLQWEKGTIVSDWSPSVKDLMNVAKENTKAEVQVASDNIKLEVNKTYATKVGLEDVNNALNLAKTQLENNIINVSNSLGNLESNINGAFKDGIINNAETISIKEQIRQLDKENLDVDKKYNAIYNNPNLKGNPKSNLSHVKNEYDVSHRSLKTTITNAIEDKNITEQESADVNAWFSDYNTKLSEFSKALQQAVDSIGSEKVSQLETVTNNKISKIEVNSNEIKQTVGSVQSTVSTHTSQIGAVDGKINTAKNEAISSASTDATNKANNAKNEALNSSKGYTNDQITSVTSTMNSKFAEIKATTDSITQTVNNVQNSITTVNDKVLKHEERLSTAEQKITSDGIFNLVKDKMTTLSSTNLIKNSLGRLGHTHWNVFKHDGYGVVTNNLYNTIDNSRDNLQFTIRDRVGTHGGLLSHAIPVKPNTKYTITAEIEQHRGSHVRIEIMCWDRIVDEAVINPNIEKLHVGNLHQSREESYTFTTPSGTRFINIYLWGEYVDHSSEYNYAHYWIRKLRLNEGEINHPWVESTTFSESKQQQLSDEISSKVSISDFNNLNHQFTEYKQSTEDFKWQVGHGLGENLVRNSGFRKDDLDWWYTHDYSPSGYDKKIFVDNDSSQWILDSKKVCVMKGTNISAGSEYGIRQNIKVKKNTIYTLSYLCAHHRCYKIGYIIRNKDASWLTTGFFSANEIGEGGKNPSRWNKIVRKFDTGDNDTISLQFSIFSSGDNGYFWVTDVCLTEGQVEQAWQPSPEEVYGSTLKLDTKELKISFEDGAYALMGRNGIEHWKNGMSNPYHYLFHRGSINRVNSQQTVRVHVPQEFKGKDYGIGWWSGNIFPSDNGDLLFSANTELVSQNKSEGWFDLKASIMVRNPNRENSPNWRGQMNLMYIIIA